MQQLVEKLVEDYGRMVQPIGFSQFGARFVLQDVNTSGDAIRIKSPDAVRSENSTDRMSIKNQVGSVLKREPAELDFIQFGNVLYFVGTERLVDEFGEVIFLRSQSAKVLKYLAGHLGNLVTRNDLIEYVWGDIAVTDDSLTQCIGDVRKALGDHNKQILKTVPKRGYSLTGTEVSATAVLTDRAADAVAANCADDSFVVAIGNLALPIDTILSSLPPELKPDQTVGGRNASQVVAYSDPEKAMAAGVFLSERFGAGVAVDYADGPAHRLKALLA